jgi:hypothetical protein
LIEQKNQRIWGFLDKLGFGWVGDKMGNFWGFGWPAVSGYGGEWLAVVFWWWVWRWVVMGVGLFWI